MEPNLAFGLDSLESGRARLRTYFSLEALPPWFRRGAEPLLDVYAFFVVLDVSSEDVARAADEWVADLASFPER